MLSTVKEAKDVFARVVLLKELLEAMPSESVANKLLMFLKEQPVDAELLGGTKIGATVNKLQKLYRKGGRHENANLAAQLVEAWRQVWRKKK